MTTKISKLQHRVHVLRLELTQMTAAHNVAEESNQQLREKVLI